MLDVVALRIGIPWTFHFFSPTYALYAAPPQKKFAVLSAVTQEEPYAAQMFRNLRTVPLFCRLLPYEGTLMLSTPFEMLVRSPVLLVCHTQDLCWPNVCRTAYTFRVPGPVFKAGLIFHSFYFLAHFSPSNIQEV